MIICISPTDGNNNWSICVLRTDFRPTENVMSKKRSAITDSYDSLSDERERKRRRQLDERQTKKIKKASETEMQITDLKEKMEKYFMQEVRDLSYWTRDDNRETRVEHSLDSRLSILDSRKN